MGQVILPNIYQCVVNAVSGSQDVVNVFGVQGSSSGQEVAACLAVKNAWKVASGPLSVKSSLYVLTQFRAMDLSTANGGIAVLSDTASGGQAGQTLATNAACALVKWNGGTRSRSSRGRLYFGPLAEADIQGDGRTLDTTKQTGINTAFTNFRNSLNGAGFPLVVISRKIPQAFPVTSHIVESIIATQRRRIRA